MWTSISEKHPPIDEMLLITDGKKVIDDVIFVKHDCNYHSRNSDFKVCDEIMYFLTHPYGYDYDRVKIKFGDISHFIVQKDLLNLI